MTQIANYMNTSNIFSIRFKSTLAVISMTTCFLGNAAMAQNPLYIDPTGNVGVGTNKPAARFHTVGDAKFDGNLNVNGLLFLNGNGKFVPNSQGTYFLWNRYCNTGGNCDGETNIINHAGRGSGGFRFENTINGTDIATLMTLSGSGSLGINAQPTYKLTVGGTGQVFGVDNTSIFAAKNASGGYESYFWPRWSDNAMYMNYGVGGFYIRNNAGNSTMFMTNSNQVGILNQAPYGPLDVSGDIYTSIHGNPGNEHDASNRGGRRIGMSLNSDFTGMELVTEGWQCGNGGFIRFLTWGCNTASTREVMRITEDAKVGINTNNPQAPLHVGNSVISSYAIQDQVSQLAYQWNANRGNDFIWGLTPPSGNNRNFDVSIFAQGSVLGRAFYAFSDARIKKNVVVSKSANDLNLLNKLKVIDYQYIDAVAHGNNVVKGFIAQDVEQVFPQAVTIHADFIPDIFATATAATTNGKKLTVSLKAPHHLVSGDKVRLMENGTTTKDVVISIVDANSFTVDDWSGSTKDLFVYGKQVNDFRTIDYQQIFATGISGMQELSKEVTDLKNENHKLIEENEANRKLLSDIQARLLALEKRGK